MAKKQGLADFESDAFRTEMYLSSLSVMDKGKTKPQKGRKPAATSGSGGRFAAQNQDDSFARLQKLVDDMPDDDGNLASLDAKGSTGEAAGVLSAAAAVQSVDMIGPDGDEPKDTNGIPEHILLEEEPVYHHCDQIMSIDTLRDQVQTFLDPIIEKKLVSQDYVEAMELVKIEYNAIADRLEKGIISQKLTMQDYVPMVKTNLSIQYDLLKKAKKEASVSAQQRIANRIEVMTQEIVACHNHENPDQLITIKDIQAQFVS